MSIQECNVQSGWQPRREQPRILKFKILVEKKTTPRILNFKILVEKKTTPRILNFKIFDCSASVFFQPRLCNPLADDPGQDELDDKSVRNKTMYEIPFSRLPCGKLHPSSP